MKPIDIANHKITQKVQITDLPSRVDLGADKKETEKALKKVRRNLGELQDTMYAHGKYSVLVCLQGMDTAGKDSLIREVFKDFNARGVEVMSFKVPTDLELKHDYLWRHYLHLPARGKFGVHNRTHYENVLVTRVHPEYILNEKLPFINSVEDVDDAFWNKRFEQIKNFENHLAENGTIIFKFFLNLSKEEQKNRLLRRLNLKRKNWKFSAGDLKERKLWDNYMACYEDAINRTSTNNAPWYNIPADDKPTARLIVASILYDTLKEYTDIKEPELDEETKANLHLYREQLNNE
ncbi:PPK2 family polyphosphate:nucleotide phosphotransferase [Mesoflavibacter sabulilitoris]|uniref:Phosphate--nucleotide phosphotransferase n=1 Tax=Mesoflavibacter zeaxanthinifaciens subsp. sabulilitoris TaxID=1520893 RepID=A0A2T1NAS1_9FLAO|nr:PPK2 family polyphosphate kinase [Mesoflavibacter zeaxanthinifaciens]MBB3123670.1 PPK2 family polyphosphate:nucleotide phosphotransferase [Mesoflavibacter zeaxanthinifaciens subsp. sabulilitoris]PSG89205.1 phosphate--nucleotide phosphotransferase [Mesoflavibacter zeaxanthinifaciens subsp. sabulilitoris]